MVRRSDSAMSSGVTSRPERESRVGGGVMPSDVPGSSVGPRIAGNGERDQVVDLLVEAFYEDPLWSWAFPDPYQRRSQHRALWGAAVDGALRYTYVWLAEGASAAAVWIPPGGTELSAEQEEGFDALVVDLLGSHAGPVQATFALFDRMHPRDVPHYYLSLLGTDPTQRGHGYGLGLLADNLRAIDAEGAPAYLEASNVVNVPLYQRFGFDVLDSFTPPGGAPEVFTMWREARRGQSAAVMADQ